jgi:ketosteroid isomerase-like protein
MQRFIVAAACTLILASALPAQQQRTDSTPQLPSVTLPADLDRVLRDYERAWAAGDAAALVALFTPDGFLLQPGRPPVRGRADIEARYRGQAGGPLKLRALSYSVDGSTGFVIGAFTYGEATNDMGKFTLTLKRADGRWLIHSDMDNPNQPPRRPPSQP